MPKPLPALPFLLLLGLLAGRIGPAFSGGSLERTAPARVEPTQDLLEGGLEAWRGDPRFWRFEEGVLVGESTEATPCERTTYLVRAGLEVGDFELTARYRIQGGNSGVQFRSRVASEEPGGHVDVVGYQADIEDGPNWTGCLYEQGGRGVMVRRGERVEVDATGARSLARFGDAGALQANVRTGDWNDYRIVAAGSYLRLEVNGQLTAELFDEDPAAASQVGNIALQLHQGPAMRVEFEQLSLRPLEAAEAETIARDAHAQAPAALAPAALAPAALAPAALAEPEALPLDPAESAAPDEARWIWAGVEPEGGEVVWFQRAFELPGAAASAHLRTGCDNVLELYLDGALVAVADDWARPVQRSASAGEGLAAQLGAGRHVLTARCENEGGPAGFWLELAVECDGEAPVRVTSDTSWTAGLGEPRAWRDGEARFEAITATEDMGPLGVEPWGTPTAWSDGKASRPNDPAELEVAPGFRVELIYSVPRHRQGSWVSMTFDPGGRLFASDQYGDLWRLTPGSDGAQPLVERVPIPLGEAHGLAFVGKTLYAVVSGAGSYASGLYRATDDDHDGELDTVVELARFDGSGEHGPHAVVPTQDGRGLWIIAGNHTALPDFVTRSRVPRLWREDQLFASFDDPNGHAVGRLAPAGWLVRCDLNGQDWELQACGMRNAYDVAETPAGDVFTFDSDMEWDVGLPWYRPTRVLQLVSGADFGWRTGSGKWPTHYVDTLPATVDIGLTSPTGVAFGTGADFPARWQEALYVSDWAYGTIHAVHLEGSGASQRGGAEPFVRGLPLPVTDLAVGPDGALWFTVGGRRAQSGVYRAVWDPERETRREERRRGAERAMRATNAADAQATGLRRALESLHTPGRADAIDIAWPYLAHAERFVRHAARVALEHQDVALWRARALAEKRPRAAAQALCALARAGEADVEAYFGALGSFDLVALETAPQLDFLRAWELGFLRVGSPADPTALAPLVALGRTLPVDDPALEHELEKLAVFAANLGAPLDVVPALVAHLERAGSQEEALSVTYLLRAAEVGWTEALTARAWDALDARRGTWTGGHSARRYVERLREALDAVAPHPEGALAVNPVEAQAALPAESEIRPAPFVQAWTLAALRPKLPALEEERDLEQGFNAYRKASCDVCHRFEDDGGATGPDLTGVASRYSAADLLRTIVLPSETIADQYQDEEVWTQDGQLYLGRVHEAADGALVVQLGPPEEGTVVVAEEDVDLRRPHPLSRMPNGLIDVLTEEEVLDLLAFLRSGSQFAEEGAESDER